MQALLFYLRQALIGLLVIEGKWILLFGPESGGKSLIAQVIMAEIQKKYPEGICLIFDTEYSLSKEWFTKLGGDPSRLFLRQTNDPTEIFDWVENKLKPKVDEGMPVKAFCIDSIAAIRFPKDIPKEGKDTTAQMMGGTGAAYLPRAFKAIVPTIRPHNITTILVQQVRENIDMYTKARNPWTVPDGKALKHYSDYIIQVERMENKDSLVKSETGVITGHTVRITCKKNKAGAPYRVAEFKLDYDKGIVGTENEVFELAKALEVITHPLNKETGEINSHQWVILDKPEEVFKPEEALRSAIANDPVMQQRVLALCAGTAIVSEREIVDE
jgi:RecA/RadA recombinase